MSSKHLRQPQANPSREGYAFTAQDRRLTAMSSLLREAYPPSGCRDAFGDLLDRLSDR